MVHVVLACKLYHPEKKTGRGERERQDKAAGNVKISFQHMGRVTGVGRLVRSKLFVYVLASSHWLFHRVRGVSTRAPGSILKLLQVVHVEDLHSWPPLWEEVTVCISTHLLHVDDYCDVWSISRSVGKLSCTVIVAACWGVCSRERLTWRMWRKESGKVTH